MVKLFEKILQKHQAKQNNKSVYKIKDLYVGEIVFFKTSVIDIPFVSDIIHYDVIKKFAIFYKNPKNDDEYIHIKTNQVLKSIHKADIHTSAIVNLTTFSEHFKVGLSKTNLSTEAKLSKTHIEFMETEVNKKLSPNKKPTDLYGL